MANGKEIYKFKAGNKNVNFPIQLCLEKVSNKLGAIDSKEVYLKENVYDFSVDYNSFNKCKFLTFTNVWWLKIIYKTFGFIKMFILLLTNLVNAYSHTKCVSLSNQKCEIQPTFITLHPNQYSQKLNYYQFTVKLDRCVGSYNTL